MTKQTTTGSLKGFFLELFTAILNAKLQAIKGRVINDHGMFIIRVFCFFSTAGRHPYR